VQQWLGYMLTYPQHGYTTSGGPDGRTAYASNTYSVLIVALAGTNVSLERPTTNILPQTTLPITGCPENASIAETFGNVVRPCCSFLSDTDAHGTISCL